MHARQWPTAREIAGVLLLATIPATIAVGLLLPLAVLVDVPARILVVTAILLGPIVSASLGPRTVRRTLADLPIADNEELADRTEVLATAVDLDPVSVRVVDCNAANVCVLTAGLDNEVVVSNRLSELEPATRDAAIVQTLVRARTKNVLLTTATVPGTLVVELWTLLGLELLRRRGDEEDTDRPRMLGEPEERSTVPQLAYPVAGLVLLTLVAPLWILATVGDRLLVDSGRLRADKLVARSDIDFETSHRSPVEDRADSSGNPVEGRSHSEEDGHTGTPDQGRVLAEALRSTQEACGAAEWVPALDRISMSSMCGEPTRRVRGTNPHLTRIRIARLSTHCF